MVVHENAASALWHRAGAIIRQAIVHLGLRRERGPIDTVEALARFAHTRAAFVAQKKLYGYLKARMGTRYPSMFEDDVFVQSINIAKWHVFAACLSDICVHAAAHVAAAGAMEGEAARRLALRCYDAGLAANREAVEDPAMPAVWRSAFLERLQAIHWENLAAGGDSFTESPRALYRWAPIADELKRHDREIVENSIRFAWVEIARDLRSRAAFNAVAEDFVARQQGKEPSPSRQTGHGHPMPE
ncbi:hypothetical protein [Chelativorans intermedius]|uniref:Esterase n=1 Tax=Chelativorans intermedius TaxID=515947 RepID=A0ABV6D3Q9_9HYPH|nr:hypothetical protein [Chelativorans intermedius]MCT8996983.1 hypothetical protein [Chelativorans intermedius]